MTVQSWSQTLQYAEGHLTQCCQGLAQRPKSISSSNLYGTKPTWPCRERSWLPFPCQLTFWKEVREVAFISIAVASSEKVSLQWSRYEKQDPTPPCANKNIIILSDIYIMLSSVLSSPQLLRTLIKSQRVHFKLQKHNSKLHIAYIAYVVLDKGVGCAHLMAKILKFDFFFFFYVLRHSVCTSYTFKMHAFTNACIGMVQI